MEEPREASATTGGDAGKSARVHALRQAPRDGLYYRSFRASIAIGLLVTLFATVYVGPAFAWRYAMFLSWTLANFVLWDYGLREMFGPRRLVFAGPLLVAKGLWIVGLVVLAFWAEAGASMENFLAFLLGFHTLILVMFLKILGAFVLDRQKTRAAQRATTGEKPRSIESGRED